MVADHVGSVGRLAAGRPGGLPANLISGNTGNGVTLRRHTHGNRVLRNYIGLGRFGRWLRNSGRPVVNSGHGNRIRANRTRPRS